MSAKSYSLETYFLIALAGVLIWSVLTVWCPQQWPFRLTEVAVFLSVIALWAHLQLTGGTTRFRWILVPFLVGAVWPIIQNSLGVSASPAATWTAAVIWASYAGEFWVAVYIFNHRILRRHFHVIAVTFAVVVASQALLQKVAHNGKLFWLIRITFPVNAMGPFFDYDHFSTFIELILPIALWRAWRHQKFSGVWLCGATVLYGSVIASTSRAGSGLVTLESLALVIALSFLGERRRGQGSRTVRFGLAVGSLFLIAAFVVGWGALMKRFALDPFAVRREVWAVAFRMACVHPLTGFGLGTWSTVYPAYSGRYAITGIGHAHNDWLEWASDGGFVFMAMIALIPLRAAWLSRRAPWGIGIVGAFVHSLVDYPLQIPTLMMWTVALLACLEVQAGRSNNSTGLSNTAIDRDYAREA